LERFVTERDETAFEVLVWRHGPMVLALGQRVLHNPHDAEDVLQATFLTLVRKANSIGKGESLSSWLYKVAYRIALRAQARAAKTVASGQSVEDVAAPQGPDEVMWRELRPLLDAAIQRLPEKYRSAIVLCDLQGKSYREAAEQLGCAIGTISTRVTRARKLLRQRLARHLPAVSAGALAAALARQAAAMPAPLTASTVRAAALLVRATGGAAEVLSANLAELIEGANQAMLMNRFKLVLLLALAAGGVAVGAGLMARREPPPPAANPSRAEAAKPKTDKPAEAVTVRGRVLDPDGKPVKGARLYWPHVLKNPPRSEDDIEYPERGKSDAEGRFQFELPRSDIFSPKMSLIATAKGYGADWAQLPAGDAPAELTLRLVKDQAIQGRIVSTEGKPLAGIQVNIVTLGATADGKLDPFLTAWKREWGIASQQTPKRLFLPANQVLASVKTDKDGQFRVSGAGVERIAVLQVRGPGISQGSLYIVGRDGFDPAEINKTVLDRTSPEERQLRQPPLLYGPKLTYVAEPTRRIEGTIREVGSGKAVAGVRILANAGYNNSMQAVSDKEGKYRLDGMPKMKQYLLTALPPENSSWLRSGARIEDKEGLQPLAVDFTLARGIVVSGRVLDRITGKGVKSNIRFVPLPGNKFASKPGYDSFKYERLTSEVGGDGRYRLTVIPGLGVLMVQAHGGDRANGDQQVNPYLAADFDAKDREQVKITQNGGDRYFTDITNSLEFLTLNDAAMQNAVKVLDLAADAGTAKCDLFVQRGQTRTIRIEDGEGKPLTGATVAGVTVSWPITFVIPDATCTVFGLDAKKPRRLVFFHAERNLGGTLTVRGDEKEAPTVRLSLAGAATGRVLDRDGQPLAGVAVNLSSPDPIASDLYRHLALPRQGVRTDKDGRFRVGGIVPEVKFTLGITQGRTFFIGEPPIGARQVKPGATLDLGDVRVKPAR
jgi:RNA polymerase sigma factor (sigma-70 family)